MRPPLTDEMLAVAAGAVADFGLQPRVRRRVWREDPGGPRTVATSTNPSIRFAWSSPAASNPYLGGEAVKLIRERVAGLDVHRDTVVACCQVKQPDRSIEVTKQSLWTPTRPLAGDIPGGAPVPLSPAGKPASGEEHGHRGRCAP